MEAIYWAFDTLPSAWEDEVQWKVTFKDVKAKIGLKADIETLHGYQTYQAVAEVATAMFADPKKTKRAFDASKDIPANKEEAQRMFREMLG